MKGRLRDERYGVVKGISSGGVGRVWRELFNRDVVMGGVAVKDRISRGVLGGWLQVFTYEFGARGLAVRIGAALCDGGVANRSCSGSSRHG